MLLTPSALSMRMLKRVVSGNSSRASLSSVTLRSITCDPRFTPPQVSFSMREYRSFVLCERPARSDITSEIEAQKVVLRALLCATSIPMSSGVAMIWRGIGMRNAVGGSETTGSNDNLISHAVKWCGAVAGEWNRHSNTRVQEPGILRSTSTRMNSVQKKLSSLR